MEGLISVILPRHSTEPSRISFKRTRRGKIRKMVRPVYFREDIPCGIIGCRACADKDTVAHPLVLNGDSDIIIFDADTTKTQIDFILNDAAVANCVIPYTSLNALQQTNRARADKLREVCKSLNASTSPPNLSRHFYAFANEFHSETLVPFDGISDQGSCRDFNACLQTAKWYSQHAPSSRIRFIVSSDSNRDTALKSGVQSCTVWEFVDSVRDRFPSAGENLTAPGITVAETEMIYPVHLSGSEISRGLAEGRFQQGVLRMAMGTCLRATVGDVEVSGKLNLNRAIDGDIVAIELFPEPEVVDESPNLYLAEELEETQSGISKTNADELAERLLGEDPSDHQTSNLSARVVGIIKRTIREIAGALRHVSDSDENRQDRIFVPTDARIPFVRIRTRNSRELEGKRIIVVIDSWDRSSRCPQGHWVEIIGTAGDRDTESAVILREHQVITREFPPDVMACLPSSDFRPSLEEVAKRRDFRSIPVCSIDPPGCKDIDDALSCEHLPNGNFRVGVHIADVTHFVHPRTAIDREAAERCTTVYLVEKRTDMLPGLLTADLCSLREKVDRLCFSVLWEMTPSGDIVSTEFHKGIINSRASLTYAAAQAMIDDSEDHSDLTVSIRNLNQLAKNIRRARMDRGGLELASQEVRFELDSETQDPTSVALYQSRETNKLVEEFMILANQAVGRQILDAFPSLSVLRRHPPPKQTQLEALRDVLMKQGFRDFKFGSNKELAESLSIINKLGDPYFNKLVRVMTTRCMNQAVYFCTGDLDPGSYWHYGLALDVYAHFTSPIRRYADVLVHRLLAASLGISALPEALQTKTLIHNQCEVMNFKHKMAQLAGRASADLHIYMFFKKIGSKACDSIITRIRRTKAGSIALHVLATEFGVEGVVTLPSGWSFNHETELATSVDGEKLSIFDHIIIKVTAEDTNLRYRTVFEFLKRAGPSDYSVKEPFEVKESVETLFA